MDKSPKEETKLFWRNSSREDIVEAERYNLRNDLIDKVAQRDRSVIIQSARIKHFGMRAIKVAFIAPETVPEVLASSTTCKCLFPAA